jgi:hypothetical protein
MTFTTTAFDCSSSWLFEALSCKTTSKVPPSSSAQHALSALLDTSRPVHHRGSPRRLQPGTSPHALRIPPRDGHPALRELRVVASGPPCSVSGFRFRARLGFSIPLTLPGPRGITPAFGYSAPHSSARGTSTLLSNTLLSAHYEAVRPCVGASVLWASRLSRLCRFPSDRQPGSQVPYEKPELESRLLYTGHRMASKQVAAMLLPE